MNGNGGSDQIILQANGTDDQAAAFGGFGNDTINAFGQGGTVDGGEAKDRFELLFGGLEFVSDSPDQGVVTTITDFVPDENVLVLPLEIDTAGSGGDTPITFEIVQADDDSYTDTIFSAVYPAATSTETAITSTATIRLLCTTNLTIADATQANLEHSRFDDF